MLRWVAAGALEAVKGFRRLKGCGDMPRLVAALPRNWSMAVMCSSDAFFVAFPPARAPQPGKQKRSYPAVNEAQALAATRAR